MAAEKATLLEVARNLHELLTEAAPSYADSLVGANVAAIIAGATDQ